MDVVLIFIKWLEISQKQKLDSLQEITSEINSWRNLSVLFTTRETSKRIW